MSKKITVLIIGSVSAILLVLLPAYADKINQITAIVLVLVTGLIEAGVITYLVKNVQQKKEFDDGQVAILMAETAKLQAETELLDAKRETK